MPEIKHFSTWKKTPEKISQGSGHYRKVNVLRPGSGVVEKEVQKMNLTSHFNANLKPPAGRCKVVQKPDTI